MSSKPILFSGPMVRAILEGRKTMTRRVMKPQVNGDIAERHLYVDLRARFQPGDILWVLETWAPFAGANCACRHYGYECKCEPYWYRADPSMDFANECEYPEDRMAWHPSIFMPKEAARIFLRVTAVRAERVQEINAHQAILEGVDTGDVLENTPESGDFAGYAVGRFRDLWDSINAKRAGGAYAWDKNPWVWVISFERVDKPAGWPEESKEARNEAD